MKIGIIGAGASGLMAAVAASSSDHEIYLFEKNEKIGKKLYITGKGRCNITNDCLDEDFFQNVVRHPEFLYSSYYGFMPFQVMEFFESNYLPLKVERGQRVFPKSDKSSDVIKCFSNLLNENKVKLELNTEILSIEKDSERFKLFTKDHIYSMDRVIIATGGFTYPLTGSTGDGYRFAKKFGHTIIQPMAGLVGLVCKVDGLASMKGLSLKNVMLKAQGKDIDREIFGEMLITHYGISGPIALSMSSYINRKDEVALFIDLKPALSEEKLDQRILREIESQINKQANTILKSLVPHSMIPTLLKLSEIPADLKGNQWTVENRRNLVHTLKNFPLNYQGLFNEKTGIVTSGGISTLEINPSTMESKIMDGLYFAGEIIDVDALTGGFNLQIALSTGKLAGEEIIK